jgi:hypothetical protein
MAVAAQTAFTAEKASGGAMPRGVAVAVVGVVAAAALGAIIATDAKWLFLGTIALAVVGVAIVARWRFGFYGLLLYLPVAGVACVALYPARLPLLFKDIIFVVPAYVGFAGALVLGRDRIRLPRVPVVLALVLAALVGIQAVRSGASNPLMALIGVKVWLGYVPLFALTLAVVRTRTDLEQLVRALAVGAVVPCLVGLAELVASNQFGYVETMQAIYGDAAPAVTQQFTRFDLGGAMLFRIPSTFTFVSQYWGFTFSMIVPAYALWRTDRSPKWRRFGGMLLALVVVAAALSGARTAFVFVPLLLVTTVALDRGLAAVSGTAARLVVVGAVLVALGIGMGRLYGTMRELTITYGRVIAYGGLVEAMQTPLGMGTGTNTGPARYALNEPNEMQGIENYYAKVVAELGVPGLVVIVWLFGWLVRSGWRTTRSLRGDLRPLAAAVTAFLLCMCLDSFKGWQIDLDPMNVYFWVFAAMILPLSRLASERSDANRGSRLRHAWARNA